MTLLHADEFLVSKEARGVLRVSESTMARWIADGTLPSVKVGGRRLIPRAAIDGLISAATGRRSDQFDLLREGSSAPDVRTTASQVGR